MTARLRNPGQHLRQLRVGRELTQEDVVRLAHGAITFQRVSRIETGAITKPPMSDLVTYGRVLGLTPNEVAALYGYWDEGKAEAQAELDTPVEVQRLFRVLGQLGDDARARLLEWVDFAVAKAIADSRPPPSGPTEFRQFAGPRHSRGPQQREVQQDW